MGCYGLGISRLMGAIVEVTADDKGLAWPHSVAPFRAHLINLGNEKETATAIQADQIYGLLNRAGIEVLWDDRRTAPGVKLADADLLGIPFRLVVSPRTAEKNVVEIKKRTADKVNLVTSQNLCAFLG